MPTSTPTLVNVLLDRLAREGKADEPWALMVLAASEGADALATYLNDGVAPRAIRTTYQTHKAAVAPKAYLRSITVAGFRGVGRAHTLELTPGPGLTVVVGRNGSGKSSYAEALEVLLTGTSFRWKDKGSQVWKSGWRNLHDGTSPRVEATCDVEGEGLVTLRRRWEAAQEVDDGATEVLSIGKPARSLDDVGWTQMVQHYRPFMSYSELGSMLGEGPSKLYNALLQGLVRQSLEEVLDEFWARHSPPMCEVSARSQLIGLNGYQAVAAFARPLYATWSGLSRACHHRPYDGAPAEGELVHWIADVERFRSVVQRTVP